MQFSLFFSYIFIVSLAILPLLSPGLKPYSLAVEPETYKTVIGISFAGFFLLFWLLNNGLTSANKIVKSKFYLPIIAFLLWNIISFIWLIDIEAGLLATLQYLSMAIAFFLALNLTYNNDELIDKLLKLLIISGVLVAVLGLLQYYFADNQAIQNFSRQAVRPGSSFGNKNMSTHFLVLVLPIAIISLWRTYYLSSIILYTTSSTIISWFLIHTYTRGGWLAVGLQLFFLLIFILLDKLKKQGTIPPPIATAQGRYIATRFTKYIIIAIGVSIFFLGANYTEHGLGKGQRFVENVNSIVQGDGSGRLPAWFNTFNLIKDHWLIGVGSGNWEANYPPYYDTIKKDAIYNERIRLRRLHNTYLEIFSNAGLIGFSFLLWLLFLTIYAVSKILLDAKHPKRHIILGVSLGLIGFSVSAMVSFPLRVYLPGVIVLAYLGIIASVYTKTKYPKATKDSYWHYSTTINKLLLLPVTALAILLAYLSYHWAYSVHYNQKAIEYRHASRMKQSLDLSIKAVEHNPYKARALGLLGEGLKRTNLPLAIDYLERSIKYNPNNSLVIIALAAGYYQLAVQKEQQSLIAERNEALKHHEKTLQHLVKIDPRNVKGYLLLSRYYLKSQQIEKAKHAYQQALKWQAYFKGRGNFGPYDSFVNAIGQMIKPYENISK